MSQKVVVIGHGYTSRLGVIRALGRAGYEVIVIVMTNYRRDGSLNTSKPIDCYSKYVSRVIYCPSDQNRLISTLHEECADPEQKVIIFTDSDFSAAAVDLNQERLRDRFLFPNINLEPGAVVAWMDKSRQKKVAREIGLNVAQGWLISIVDGHFDLPIDIRYPCFLKPVATLYGGKVGLKRCGNEEELRKVLGFLINRRPTIKVLVEEFQEIETEYALVGFSSGDRVLIPGIIQMKSLSRGRHFGVAMQGEIMPSDGFEDLIEKFTSFVRRTGFLGVFDIDFYKSDGELFFCEMNFRYGGSGYAYTASGVNLPEIMARCLLGKTVDFDSSVKSPAVFINERMCRDDWEDGIISSKEFCKMRKTSAISFIEDSEDISPSIQFRKSLLNPIMNAKRLLKRIMRII